MREVTRKKRKNDDALRFKTPHPVPRCRILHIYFSPMNKQTAGVFMGSMFVFLLYRVERKGMEMVMVMRKGMTKGHPKIARRSARSLKMTFCGQRPEMP